MGAIEERLEHEMRKTRQSIANLHNMLHSVGEGCKKDAGRIEEFLVETGKTLKQLEVGGTPMKNIDMQQARASQGIILGEWPGGTLSATIVAASSIGSGLWGSTSRAPCCSPTRRGRLVRSQRSRSRRSECSSWGGTCSSAFRRRQEQRHPVEQLWNDHQVWTAAAMARDSRRTCAAEVSEIGK